jgi:predicted DNA-binding transcriptional regulator YafY
MDIDAKLRPIYLMQILKERTDEDHYLSTAQLCKILLDEYGMETHRTTIKSDIEMLQRAGIGIQATRSTQNLYNFIEREFDNAELKLLIDAVESSKFITKAKSDQLVSKIIALAGVNKAREMKRNLAVDGRYKAENEHIYYIVDAINDAINQKKKIRFQKVEYNVKKERVLHHGGEKYTFSPYSLVWDGDFYYVVGYSDKYQNIGSHRVDRIAEMPEILSESAIPAPVGFDINKFINTMFRMYNAPRKEVELICDNSVMDAIIDKFGIDAPVYACDQQNFRVITEVAVGPVFFNWIFGFRGKVKIKGPEDVKKAYAEMVKAAADSLE